MPMTPGAKRWAIEALPVRAWAFTSRMASLATTGGVRTTASAKLNSSSFCRDRPSTRPVEMVAPDRENPRNGRQMPCTMPIQHECIRLNFRLARRFFLLHSGVNNQHPPLAASAPAINGRLANKVFDLRMRHAAHEDFLNDDFQSVTHDPGAERVRRKRSERQTPEVFPAGMK